MRSWGWATCSTTTGSSTHFHNAYDPTWGRLKAVTYPAPGNHEYYSSGAPGYYGYFVASAGGTQGGTVDPWYAADVGSWRVIALNSNCGAVGGAGWVSPQENWLRQELAAHPARCTVAFWHAPRFSSGVHGDDTTFDAFWRDLTAAGADLVLSGHDHSYERFAPMNAFGGPSPSGMREFVSGLGGKSLTGFTHTPRAASEVAPVPSTPGSSAWTCVRTATTGTNSPSRGRPLRRRRREFGLPLTASASASRRPHRGRGKLSEVCGVVDNVRPVTDIQRALAPSRS